MDLDIEMDDAVDVPPVPEAYITDIIADYEQEPGEVEESHPEDNRSDERAIVPYKIHVRGLDTFNPEEVKGYVAEHFSSGLFDRVEWIDDSSANLVFKSESTAQEALIALSSVEIADATQLPPLEALPAKPYSGKPDSTLLVRLAVTGDRKEVGAAARSRFYLLHPEYDPEERRRRGGSNRGNYRDREGYGRDRDRRGARRGDRRDDRRDDRRRDNRYGDEESEPFDVSLYDDDEASLAKRANLKPRLPRASVSSGDEDRYTRRNRDKELLPNRRPRERDGISGRDRSASPIRDDLRMEVDDLARDQEAATQNRDKARTIKDRLSKDNRAKELFPTKLSSSAPGSKAQMDQVDEGTILSSGMSRMSLYINHHWGLDGCSDAPQRSFGVYTRLLYSYSHQLGSIIDSFKAKLADRITPRTTTEVSSGFNIRGLANKRGADQGFAIKGTGPSAKELFPEKFGNNATKELFADKLENRGRRRQKAEDSFL
ncbi:hypothetical protein QBC33DRAFT_555965 [Phialemonium atrogriseum]|uniref:Uncharacterized protein n=1 Tax=Phialemonium atrogriseum TaxID=1093897 RepID=A0AAJ0FJZ3_9PEZI|nr:uncharacterized protein QBC33DRAFT_555965 [Phialemonium atrogriseum]KAK1770487.1 hypothetical protein QBC33DRAFT_555965 [Phialemonium atrogriseum]